MLKIVHVSTALSWRGGEQQVFYLAQSIAQIDKDVQQWIFCAKGSVMEQRCKAALLPYKSCLKTWSFNPFFAYKLAVFCRKNTVDLLHLHDPHAHNFAILSADLFGNSIPMILSRRVDFAPKNSIYTHYKYNHACIKSIICVSEAIKKVMIPHIEQTQKLSVIYSGIDLQKFVQPLPLKVPSILRHQYSLLPTTILIGNVAALAPHKDYQTFLDTAYLLCRQGLDARFLLIGEGSERSVLEQYAQTKGIADKVIFTGFRSDIAQILPQIDIMLVTSTEEGLGTSVLDAFAAGTPVVATQAGGLIELVKHEQTGLSAPIKDAVQLATCVMRLLNDKVLRENIQQKAAIFVKNFTKEITAQKTLALYRDIIQKSTSELA